MREIKRQGGNKQTTLQGEEQRKIVVYRAIARMLNAECKMQNYGVYFINYEKYGRSSIPSF